MRRPLTFGVVFGATIFLSFSNPAGAQSGGQSGIRSGVDYGALTDMRWEVMSTGERALIDRLAADFYEASLRRAQADAIEDRTGELYRQAAPAERARFRAERRDAWRSLSAPQREALRGAKRPAFRNLTESQKAPFRRHALDQLAGAGAIDRDALAQSLRNDI